MIPQGSVTLNTTQMANTITAVNQCQSCAALQAHVTSAFASLGALKTAMASQLSEISPLLALLTPPAANPTAIVTWLQTFITAYLTPIVKPDVTIAAQQTALAAQISLNGVIIDSSGNLTSPATVKGNTDVIAGTISGKTHIHDFDGSPTTPPMA